MPNSDSKIKNYPRADAIRRDLDLPISMDHGKKFRIIQARISLLPRSRGYERLRRIDSLEQLRQVRVRL